MFFVPNKTNLNLEILMSLKLQKKEWLELKLVHHITQAHKSGKINHMIPNVIFGL